MSTPIPPKHVQTAAAYDDSAQSMGEQGNTHGVFGKVQEARFRSRHQPEVDTSFDVEMDAGIHHQAQVAAQR